MANILYLVHRMPYPPNTGDKVRSYHLLRHLQRQAATARRYQALKQDERQLQAELLALRLREVESEAGARQAILNERDLALQAALAEQRSHEAAIERARHEHDGSRPVDIQARPRQADPPD